MEIGTEEVLLHTLHTLPPLRDLLPSDEPAAPGTTETHFWQKQVRQSLGFLAPPKWSARPKFRMPLPKALGTTPCLGWGRLRD